MLYPEYRKDINCYRLILPDKNPVVSDYQYEMLLHNHIEGILPVTKQFQNGIGSYSYDISDKISLQKMYETVDMSYANLRDLFAALKMVVNRMQEFLLDEACILLHQDFIYFDTNTRQIEFVFYPYAEECHKYSKGFRELSEFIIAHTDHEDERALDFAYSVFKESREDSFTLQNIMKKLENKEIEKEDTYAKIDVSDFMEGIDSEEEDLRQSYGEYHKKEVSKEKKKRLIISCISLFLLVCLSAYVLLIKPGPAELADYIMGILFLTIPLFLWFDYKERVR